MNRIGAINPYNNSNYAVSLGIKKNVNNEKAISQNPKSQKNISFKAIAPIGLSSNNAVLYKKALATFLGFVGISAFSKSERNKNFVTDERQLLSNYLRSQTYISSIDNKTQKPLYSEEAIKKIDECYSEEDKGYVQNLVKAFQYSTKGLYPEDIDYIAKTTKNYPKRVELFRGINKYPYEYIKYLKAAEIDEKLTHKIATEDTKFVYYPHYSPQDTLDLVSATKEYGIEAIDKYITEKRVFLDKDNIIKLASKDKDSSNEIEEIISFIDEEDFSNKLHVNFISEILPVYQKKSIEVKDLLKMGIYDTRKIKASIDSYSKSPEAFKVLYYKEREFSFVQDIDFQSLSDYSLKLEKYKDQIKKIKGSSYQELELDNLKAIIDDFEKKK